MYIILVTIALCEITENCFLFVFALCILLHEITEEAALEWYSSNFLKLEKGEKDYVLIFSEIFHLDCANLSWRIQPSHWLEFSNDN